MGMENGYSLSDVAAAARGSDGFGCGADSWVLIILFALIFGGGGFGWGNNGAVGATTADIQRAVDLNSIQEGQRAIAADIQRTTYENMSVTKDAAYNNLSEIRDTQAYAANGFFALQNCCCETNRNIDSVKFDMANYSAAIQANDTANTQKILDAITCNRMADMQNQINQLQLQTALGNVVRYPTMSAYCSGSNPFCNCGSNNCGCGC